VKHDIFEFNAETMTFADKAWRVVFLLVCICTLLADLFIWRP